MFLDDLLLLFREGLLAFPVQLVGHDGLMLLPVGDSPVFGATPAVADS